MSRAFELHDSRIDSIVLADGRATIHFPVAYIHQSRGTPGRDPGSGWTQEAELTLEDAVLAQPLPPLPNMIFEGHLEVGGIKHEMIPLPFQRKVAATLRLTFADGNRLEIAGRRPRLELSGQSIFLEEFP